MAAARLMRSVHFGVVVVVVFLFVVAASGSEDRAGDEKYEVGAMGNGLPVRHLLQTVTSCPIDFGTMNYSSITTVCNASNVDKTACCTAFTNFACPYASYLNDATTDCATLMFTYLNLAGNYPSQLFQICTGDANGLLCPDAPAPAPVNPSSASLHRPWGLAFAVICLSTLVSFILHT